MHRIFRPFALIVFILSAWGCSQDQPAANVAKDSQPAAQDTTATQQDSSHLLVFFLDPNGGPCRQQGSILTQMKDQLDGKVRVRPVQTTVPEDRGLFSAYGVRALPTLLLADSSGREIDRLPPGVQSSAQIEQLLQRIPGD